MNLLANAHISRAMCAFLYSEGHDCLHAEELSPGLADDELLRIARDEQRIVLTGDKDFGELVFRRLLVVPGVILLRLRAPSEAERLALFQGHWPVVAQSVSGYFVVVTNKRVRRTPLPSISSNG